MLSALITTMLDIFSRFDILVPIYGLAERVPADDFQFVMNINLRGTLTCPRRAEKTFQNLGEGIIFSPVRGFAGDPGFVTCQ